MTGDEALVDPDLLTGRLFFGIPVPGPARAPLERVLPRLLPSEGGRITYPGGWHLTLAFLGRVRAELATEVVTAGERAAAAGRPLDLRLEGAGAFPSAGRARVLWAGLAGDVETAGAVAVELAKACAELGLREQEMRPFEPHVTVVRFAKPVALEQRTVDGLAEAAGAAPGFSARQLCCYRSTVTHQGARYEVVRRFPLGRPVD